MHLNHPKLIDLLRKTYSAEKAAAFVMHSFNYGAPPACVSQHVVIRDDFNILIVCL